MNSPTHPTRVASRNHASCQASVICRPLPLAGAVLSLLAGTASAFEVPGSIRIESGALCWVSSAPSVNVYIDGVYTRTVHGGQCAGEVQPGAVYRLVAHDHGREFSSLSDPFMAPDAQAGAGSGRGNGNGNGDHDDDDDDDDDGTELEFSEAELYLELNDTDGDLGLHASIDGQVWEELEIKTPEDVTLFELSVSAGLRDQGMTELFFESHEPTFDDLPPADFFRRFPEGVYTVEGTTLLGEDIENEVELSHVIPAAPTDIQVGSLSAQRSCDDGGAPVVSGSLEVSWSPVTTSHATIGATGPIELDVYELAVDREEPALSLKIELDPIFTRFELPGVLFSPGEQVKIEVLAIADTASRTGTEGCFIVGN